MGVRDGSPEPLPELGCELQKEVAGFQGERREEERERERCD